jgi:hypothetical protein
VECRELREWSVLLQIECGRCRSTAENVARKIAPGDITQLLCARDLIVLHWKIVFLAPIGCVARDNRIQNHHTGKTVGKGSGFRSTFGIVHVRER